MSTSPAAPRPNDRSADSLRPVTLELGRMKYAEGSALIQVGDTHVLISASVEDRVPPFLRDSGQGWLTAEYSMLPRATSTRSSREVSRGRPSGRTSEIQRLIGRSLRAAVDLRALGERMLTLDCDVLQADGGTRTASVTGAYAAMVQAVGHLFLRGDLDRWPVVAQVAAVSVGLSGGVPVLDLEYIEDQEAGVDMNVVATAAGELIEVQGTAEGKPFSRAELDALLDLAQRGIAQLAEIQNQALRPVMAEVEAKQARGTRPKVEPKSEKDLWGRPE